jgi:hypothetical protein
VSICNRRRISRCASSCFVDLSSLESLTVISRSLWGTSARFLHQMRAQNLRGQESGFALTVAPKLRCFRVDPCR